MALILSRPEDESIQIADNITVTIQQINGHQAKVAIDAPPEVEIMRTELLEKDRQHDNK
ncbi:carbon storage regulator [Pseudomonadales bacterium]|nr:carbon storage regulator [Pseudomonadales bacterium]